MREGRKKKGGGGGVGLCDEHAVSANLPMPRILASDGEVAPAPFLHQAAVIAVTNGGLFVAHTQSMTAQGQGEEPTRKKERTRKNKNRNKTRAQTAAQHTLFVQLLVQRCHIICII